jgi:hypothetical protein
MLQALAARPALMVRMCIGSAVIGASVAIVRKDLESYDFFKNKPQAQSPRLPELGDRVEIEYSYWRDNGLSVLFTPNPIGHWKGVYVFSSCPRFGVIPRIGYQLETNAFKNDENDERSGPHTWFDAPPAFLHVQEVRGLWRKV